MEGTTKVKYCKRRKIPLTGRIIISAEELADIEDDLASAQARLADLKIKYKHLLFASDVRAKTIGKLLWRINVLSGRIPAPPCPRCGKPKTAGGIQWIDHAVCYAGNAKGKSQKGKI